MMNAPTNARNSRPLLSAEVADAQADGRAVVALESTIFSHLGLPSPDNAEGLARCEAAIRAAGAVPAVTAVLDGEVRLGVEPHEAERILGAASKMAERDIGVAVGQRWSFGASTVSAAVAIAELGGVSVFATGGIGGVHREVAETGDVSADLGAIARRRVTTVCAGAKSFLDLPRTLEHLEALGVPVIGFGTDEFPAFYGRRSGIALNVRADEAHDVAAIVTAHAAYGAGGVLVAVPIPADAALDDDLLDAAITEALDAARADGVRGAAVTPFVLAALSAATEGKSLPANLTLAENNASVAAAIAVALAN